EPSVLLKMTVFVVTLTPLELIPRRCSPPKYWEESYRALVVPAVTSLIAALVPSPPLIAVNAWPPGLFSKSTPVSCAATARRSLLRSNDRLWGAPTTRPPPLSPCHAPVVVVGLPRT